MKTKSILLLVLIASAMIQVFVYLCICVFVYLCLCSLILEMIQDQALVASKHFLIETENKTVADNAEVGRVVCFLSGSAFCTAL